jgi:hypothetical protein
MHEKIYMTVMVFFVSLHFISEDCVCFIKTFIIRLWCGIYSLHITGIRFGDLDFSYVIRVFVWKLSTSQTHGIYRAFHNVLRDYKHLLQENQRTYLNGIVHSHRKTEKVFLRTRDVRCVHHGWHGTHRTSIVGKISFPVAVNNLIKVGPLVFLL